MVSEELTKEVNHWMRYRESGAPPYIPPEIQNYCRIHDSVEVFPRAGPDFQGFGGDQNARLGKLMFPPPPPETTGSVRVFLGKMMPGLSDDPKEAAFWKGGKYLREGASGMVGHSEYKNPEPNSNGLAIREVVVKEVKAGKDNYKYDLTQEAAHRVAILQNGSNHIVGLTHRPRAIRAQDESLEPERDGSVRRLRLEYCALESLSTLIDQRIL
jgi:hypothetical protein